VSGAPTKTKASAAIAAHDRLTEDIALVELEAPEIARLASPGQFVAIRVAQTESPLLRRPFSIASSDGGRSIGLIYRIVGVGTRLLAEKRVGETLDVIGPLGRGFEIFEDRPAALVAGGIGIPPIAFLARVLHSKGIPATLFYGARTKSELAVLENVADFVARLVVATDDGSAGHRGPVSEVVEKELSDDQRLYACGPRPLLEILIRLARERRIAAQLSFEQQMACAVGACMGCSIATAEGYKRVCTEGPVFPAEIFFDR